MADSEEIAIEMSHLREDATNEEESAEKREDANNKEEPVSSCIPKRCFIPKCFTNFPWCKSRSRMTISGFLWSMSIQDKHRYLEVRKNGTEVFYSGENHDFVTRSATVLGIMIRADRPILRQGQFYFEICVENTGQDSVIAVGICTRSSRLDQFPGWAQNSFGYHGDDGNIYCESGSPTYRPEKPFKPGCLIGVLLDFNKSTLTFSREKKEVQIIQLQSRHMNQDYYPCVGNRSPGAVMRLTKPILVPKSGAT